MNWSILVIFLLDSIRAQENDEHALLGNLLQNLEPFVRPVRDRRRPVNVTFGFTLNQILDLDEKQQFITMKIWLRMRWVNEFMKWDPSKWDNITTTRVSKDDVWTPGIFVMDDVSDDVSQGPFSYKTEVIVSHKGECSWFIPVKLESSCSVEVSEFPFDHQICTLVFLPWTHSRKELDLIPEDKPIITSYYLNSSEWFLKSANLSVRPRKYDCCVDPFVTLEYKFGLLRRSVYHFHFLVIPCIIQVLLILSTFCLPLESGERVGVIITILLVFAVYLQVLSDALPETSTSTPLLSKFLITVMAESAFLLIVNFVIMKAFFKGSTAGAGKVPCWMKTIFFEYISKLVLLSYRERKRFCKHHDKNGTINPINENDKKLLLNNQAFISRLSTISSTDQNGINDEKCTQNQALNEQFSLNTQLVHNATLMEQIGIIVKCVQEQKEQDEIGDEWRYLARILNRLCFLIFLFIFLATTVVTLVQRGPVDKPFHDIS